MPSPRLPTRTFLGLDVSLNHTGVCRITGKPEEIGSENMAADEFCPKLVGMARLDWIEMRVKSYLQAHKPYLVAIEGYAHASKFQTHQLGEIGGIIRLLMWRMGIPYVVVAPKALKAFIVEGRKVGDKDKKAIRKAIKTRWGHDFTNNNHADAFGLAMIAKMAAVTNPETLGGTWYELIQSLKGSYRWGPITLTAPLSGGGGF